MGSDACINLLTTATDPELSSGSVHRARRTFSSTVRRAAGRTTTATAARVSSIDTPFPRVTALSDPAICAARECVGAELGVPLHDGSGHGLDRRQCGPGLESRGARAAIGRRGRLASRHLFPLADGARASGTMPGAVNFDAASAFAWALSRDPELPVSAGSPPHAHEFTPATQAALSLLASNPQAIRIVCICQSGFTEVPHRAGMAAIHLALSEQTPLRDRVLCPLLALEPWETDVDVQVEKTLMMQPTLVMHVGHSYGDGEGLVQYAARLARRGLAVDYAIMIDPVRRYRIGSKRLACEPGRPFPVPANVRNVLCWRTIHQPPASLTRIVRPMGHIPVCGDGTRLLLDKVYGTALDFDTAKREGHDCGTHQVIQPSHKVYTHTTIDNAPDVRDELVSAVAGIVRQHIAERSAA